MKKRTSGIIVAFMLLCMSSIVYAETFDRYFKILPGYTTTCDDVTGVWQGELIGLYPQIDDHSNAPIKLALYNNHGKVIGKIIHIGENADIGVSGQIWASCKKGTLYNIRFPVQKLDLNNMPKNSDNIQAPIAPSSVLLTKNNVLLHIASCDSMGTANTAVAILKKISNHYPYNFPEMGYDFPSYSKDFKPLEPNCDNSSILEISII